MKTTANLAFSAACFMLMGPVRAQFQVVHDAPNTTTTAQLTPLILADGNTVTHQWNAGEHVFRKYDESGALLWSRVLAGNAISTFDNGKAVSLLSDAADGFIFLAHDSILIYGSGPLPEDSLVYSYRIVRINGDGDLTSAVLLKKNFIPLWFDGSWPLAGFDAARTPDSGVVICMTTDDAVNGSIDMVKVGADGTLEWGRSVGNPVGTATGAQPTRAFNSEPNGTVAVSSTGRIYYSEGGDYTSHHLRLAALDTDGSMFWMKRYVYGNSSPMVQYDDIAVDGNGDVHAAGPLTTTVGRFHIFLRIGADGVLERGDIYRTPLNILANGQLGLDSQGRRYHRVPATDLATGAGRHGILIADTLGTPARFVRRHDEVVLPNNVFVVPERMAVAGERLAVSNLLHHEDVDFAYTTRYEALSMFTTDDIDPCLMDDTTFAHIAVPLDPIMTTVDVPEATSLDVSAYYSVEPLTLSLTEPDAEVLGPLCEFVAELLDPSTGMNNAAVVETLPLIQNTLVARGTPIALNGTAVVIVEVYDSNGALIHRSQLNDSRGLPSATWSPGMYLIRALDLEGTTTGMGRVVLE